MSFRFPLLVFFILVPLLEIYVLIKVGGVIGAIPTVFLVVFTAVLGALLLRHQGFYTLAKVRRQLERGEVPAVAMFEGAVLLIGGLFLVLPGFLTDLLGLLTLVPAVRRAVVRGILRRSAGHGPPGPSGPAEKPGQRTIEGEFRRED